MVWVLNAAIVAGVLQNMLLFGLVAGATLWTALRVRSRSGLAWLPVVALCVLVGHAAGADVRGDTAHVSTIAARQGAALVWMTGRVSSFPASGPFGTRFVFDTRLEGRRVRLLVRAGLYDAGYGECYRLRGRLVMRPDGAHLFARGVAGEARVRFRDIARAGECGWCSPYRKLFWRLHRDVRARLSRHLGNDAALPLALLLGERGYLDASFREAVARLGIAHLLALSGMHLGSVALLVLMATRRAPRGREWALIVLLTGYVAMVGDIESLTRAYLMAVLMTAARVLARPVRAMDALGKAMFLMMLASPVSILSVGLQLSLCATLVVVAVAQRFSSRESGARTDGGSPMGRVRRALRFLAAAFLMSAAVGVVVAPIQLHYFGRISVAGPLATAVFVLPVMALQMMSLALGAVLDMPLAGDAAAGCLLATSRYFTDGVLAAAGMVPDPVAWPEPRAVPYYAAVVLVWRYPRRTAAWVGGAILLAASMMHA